MLLDILTPKKHEFSGEVTLIQLPGVDGSFEILQNHAPLISLLAAGKIKILEKEKQEKFFQIKGGMIEFKNNTATVLAEI